MLGHQQAADQFIRVGLGTPGWRAVFYVTKPSKWSRRHRLLLAQRYHLLVLHAHRLRVGATTPTDTCMRTTAFRLRHTWFPDVVWPSLQPCAHRRVVLAIQQPMHSEQGLLQRAVRIAMDQLVCCVQPGDDRGWRLPCIPRGSDRPWQHFAAHCLP